MLSPRYVASEIRANFSSIGWWRDRVFVPFVVGTLTRAHPRYPGYDEAVRVMDEDWDNLFVLDACRADAFEAAVDLNRFDDYSRVVSLGSHSSEWTRRNFRGGTFDDTVYVSANPHTTLLADDAFHELVEVWKAHSVSPNVINPAVLAEAAVRANEIHSEKRLIVHFMQPHGTGGLVEPGPSREETYHTSIEPVVDVVVDLAERLGGRTVISADHGELFSDGLLSRLGIDQHKARLRLPELVYVPWAEIEGERRAVTAGGSSTTDTDPGLVQDRLRDLGYHA